MAIPLPLTLGIGAVAGVLGGLVGLGGGVVMIPLLIARAGLTRHQAHATSLAAVIATGAVGAATYGLRGKLEVPLAGILGAAALVAAHGGARLAHRIDARRLHLVFGWFLVAIAGVLLAKPWLGALATAPASAITWAGLGLTGAAAGFIAGLLGVGGGSIMVPGLVLLAGLDQHAAQGTSLLAMVPAAIVGTWTHARAGAVVGGTLPGLIPGVLVGTVAGGLIATQLPESWLRLVFAAFLLWLGWRDVRGASASPAQPLPVVSGSARSPS